jgi:hypothetical protein
MSVVPDIASPSNPLCGLQVPCCPAGWVMLTGASGMEHSSA